MGREKENGNVRFFPDFPKEGETVSVREHYIQDDEIRERLCKGFLRQTNKLYGMNYAGMATNQKEAAELAKKL